MKQLFLFYYQSYITSSIHKITLQRIRFYTYVGLIKVRHLLLRFKFGLWILLLEVITVQVYTTFLHPFLSFFLCLSLPPSLSFFLPLSLIPLLSLSLTFSSFLSLPLLSKNKPLSLSYFPLSLSLLLSLYSSVTHTASLTHTLSLSLFSLSHLFIIYHALPHSSQSPSLNSPLSPSLLLSPSFCPSLSFPSLPHSHPSTPLSNFFSILLKFFSDLIKKTENMNFDHFLKQLPNYPVNMDPSTLAQNP